MAENKKEHIKLENLEIYQVGRELSKTVWLIFKDLDFQSKKLNGDQFVRATDSVAANIAEGYGRYHYLDKIKFMYNARGSLVESKHWFETIDERNNINPDLSQRYKVLYSNLEPKLNAYISSIYRTKINKPQN